MKLGHAIAIVMIAAEHVAHPSPHLSVFRLIAFDGRENRPNDTNRHLVCFVISVKLADHRWHLMLNITLVKYIYMLPHLKILLISNPCFTFTMIQNYRGCI
ncbi:hypothetical protein BFP76_10010 [Amylibacter kogurei]|uniref:Uncharacterized protein n=1 Tax=Paramylibacter kogurei TaxID=1889778 RepID=A0A2G5JZZ2_9RHOB|nr:hypothetical protein BFP76_10010 [Amylibacter kogurei]